MSMNVWHVMVWNGASTGNLHEVYGTAGIFSSQEMAERACIGRRNYCIVGPVSLDKPFPVRAHTCEEAGMVGYWPESDGFRVIDPSIAMPLWHPEDAQLAANETPWPWEVTADLIAKAPDLVRDFALLHGEAEA